MNRNKTKNNDIRLCNEINLVIYCTHKAAMVGEHILTREQS